MVPSEPGAELDTRHYREARLVELQPRLRLYFGLKLTDGPTVDDAVQETNERVLARIENRHEGANFDAHVFAVARFVFLEKIRPDREVSSDVEIDDRDDEQADTPLVSRARRDALTWPQGEEPSIRLTSSGAHVPMSVLFPFLWQCVDQLSDYDQELFDLRWGPASRDLSSKVAGERLGVNAAAVDNRAARLKRKLEACARARLAAGSDRKSDGRAL